MKDLKMNIIKNLYDTCEKDIVASIYHEPTTDVLYLKAWGNQVSFTVMLDPATGLPLTYKVWKAKYYKE